MNPEPGGGRLTCLCLRVPFTWTREERQSKEAAPGGRGGLHRRKEVVAQVVPATREGMSRPERPLIHSLGRDTVSLFSVGTRLLFSRSLRYFFKVSSFVEF